MRKSGLVKKDGEWATVSVLRASSCGENCAMCKGGCTPGETEIVAENKIGAKAGDKVVLEISDKSGLAAAFLAYIVPLIFLIAACGVLVYLGVSEGLAFLGGVVVMALVYFAVRCITRRKGDDFKVKIVSVIG